MNTNIAIVIVNWNKKQDVLALLGELVGIPEAVDIYVVDNASTDDSVASIRRSFPGVQVIVNRQNFGGTGGFNTGLYHICQCEQYEYVWLLDNDARIKTDSLTALLEVMNADTGIGLAGSRIVDIDNEKITVETGGNFRWDRIGVEPLSRNTRGNQNKVINADYVAICSALVRVQALRNVGLMDDRFFVFWDDMDWGLYFKEKGYQVVCVSKSIVYHGSFTERERGKPTGYYYGIRNSFLVYSKHTAIFNRFPLFYRALRGLLRNYIFYAFHKKREETELMRKAFLDFLNNNWGKLVMGNKTEKNILKNPTQKKGLLPTAPLKNILVSVIGSSFENCQKLLYKIKKVHPESYITLLIHDDRTEYFREFDHILVSRSKTQRVKYIWSKYFNIKRRNFDAAVTIHPHPFLYAVDKIIYVDANGKSLTENRAGTLKLMVFGIAMVWGEIMAHMFLPLVILKSFQYKLKANKVFSPMRAPEG